MSKTTDNEARKQRNLDRTTLNQDQFDFEIRLIVQRIAN